MTRGRKPKAPSLRLIDGTHRDTRHGPADYAREAVDSARAAFGPLEMPAYLKGHARSAWKSYVAPAVWLDASRGVSALAFCELWAEMRRAPTSFPAAKHALAQRLLRFKDNGQKPQRRLKKEDLGLTDQRKRAVAAATEAADEHFDGD